MIAKQQSSPGRDRPQSLEPRRRTRAWGTSWLDAMLDGVASDASRFRWFMIVSVLAALAWVWFVGVAMLRPTVIIPKQVAALPPLISATPRASADSPGSFSGFKPESVGSSGAQDENAAGVLPAVSAAPAAPAHALPPPSRKATGKNDDATIGAASKPIAAPSPPPAKFITVTIRTFHPPVISSMYKDMVADKMKEQGLDPRLEAKVRSGQQLTKEDLASIRKPVMERLNKEVVAYGQPPLYTDSTSTVLASASH